MSENKLTETIFCAECGRNFVYFLGGIPQKICGYCAGVDMDLGEE